MEQPDMHDVIQLYQKQIGPLTGSQRDKLYYVYDEGMSPFVIGCAILKAKQQQKKKYYQGINKRISFNYIWAIIEDLQLHGILSEQAFKDYWHDQQRETDKLTRSEKYAQASPKQFVRSDFKYTKPQPPSKDFFALLDE